MRFVCVVALFAVLTGFSVVKQVPTGLGLTPENRLHLAQVVVGEADWRRPDHIAIAWVLTKRWKMFQRSPKYDPATQDFSWFIMHYSVPMRSNKKRAQLIRQLPWGDPIQPHSTGVRLEKYTERWAKARKTITQWYEGKYPDPCPEALHWGGTMDNPDKIQRPGVVWEPLSCGNTRNIFYKPVPIKKNNGQ